MNWSNINERVTGSRYMVFTGNPYSKLLCYLYYLLLLADSKTSWQTAFRKGFLHLMGEGEVETLSHFWNFF